MSYASPDPAPGPYPAYSPQPTSGRLFWIVALILLACGLAALAQGFHVYNEAKEVESPPLKIACRDLQNNGYGDNPHIELTNFLFSEEFFFKGGSESGGWSQIWVPLVPEDAVDASSFRVLLTSHDHNSDAEMEKLYEQLELECVVGSVDDMPRDEREELQKLMPAMNLGGLYLLEYAEHRPPATTGIAVIAGGGVLLGLAAVALMLFFFKKQQTHLPPDARFGSDLEGGSFPGNPMS